MGCGDEFGNLPWPMIWQDFFFLINILAVSKEKKPNNWHLWAEFTMKTV